MFHFHFLHVPAFEQQARGAGVAFKGDGFCFVGQRFVCSLFEFWRKGKGKSKDSQAKPKPQQTGQSRPRRRGGTNVCPYRGETTRVACGRSGGCPA